MLFIHPDQMMAFSVDGMERQVMAFLREEFPACFAHADRNALRALIGRALAPATGMRTEHDIARYAMLGLIIRPDFDSHPATQWAWPEPGDQGRNGEARLNRLYALARRHGYTLAAAGASQAAQDAAKQRGRRCKRRCDLKVVRHRSRLHHGGETYFLTVMKREERGCSGGHSGQGPGHGLMCDFSDYHEQMVYSDFHARFDLSIDVSGEGKLS